MSPQEKASEAWSDLRAETRRGLKDLDNPLIHPFHFISEIIQWQFQFYFIIFQWFADKLFSPTPPGPSTRLGRPKVAIIGAGITGVTSAAHCIGHGFDVVIFEAGDENSLGGIWSVRILNLPLSTNRSNLYLLTIHCITESEQHLELANPFIYV